VLWARRQDPVSLTNLVALLAGAGQVKGFSSKKMVMMRRGQEKK